ncbi:MAG: hypothetical protein JXA01_02460 [Dehalococcoidia bacterium]|nr:hypothetical protein [Dehalococcoidia bacterium]
MELKLEPFASRLRWQFARKQSLEYWQALFEDLLEQLAQACNAGNPKLIGHIKCVALLPDGGFLRGSKISMHYASDMEIKTEKSISYNTLVLSLNMLVYGLSIFEARHILQETALFIAQKWDAGQEILDISNSCKHRDDHKQ